MAIYTTDYDPFGDGSLAIKYLLDGDTADLLAANDAAWVGTATYADAKFDQGINLDGGTSYVENTTYQHPAEQSLSCWCQPSEIGTTWPDYFSTIYSTRDANASTGFSIWFSNDSGNHTVEFVSRDANVTATKTYDGSFTWTAGTWYHVGVTIGASAVIVYIDGTRVLEYSLSAAFSGMTNGFCIGSERGHTDYVYTGLIDQVEIYSRVLTATEIADLSNETIPPAFVSVVNTMPYRMMAFRRSSVQMPYRIGRFGTVSAEMPYRIKGGVESFVTSFHYGLGREIVLTRIVRKPSI